MIYRIYGPKGNLEFSIESTMPDINIGLESLSNTIDNMINDMNSSFNTPNESQLSIEDFKESMQNIGKAISKKFSEILDKIIELFEKIRYNISKILAARHREQFTTVMKNVSHIKKDFTKYNGASKDRMDRLEELDLNRYLFQFKTDVGNVYSKIPGFNFNQEVLETIVMAETLLENQSLKAFLQEENIDDILSGRNNHIIDDLNKSLSEDGGLNYTTITSNDSKVLDQIKKVCVHINNLDNIAKMSLNKAKTLKKALKNLNQDDDVQGNQKRIVQRINILNTIAKRCMRGVGVLNSQILVPISQYKYYTNRLDDK